MKFLTRPHVVMRPFNCTAQVTPDGRDMGRVQIQKWRRGRVENNGSSREHIYLHNCFLGGASTARKPGRRAPSRLDCQQLDGRRLR